MGDRLRLDLGTVRDTATRIGRIHGNLQGAQSQAVDVSAAIPHGGLADAVSHFGTNWDVAREELIGRLDSLRQATDAVADTFTEVDGEMAKRVAEGSENGR